MKIGITIDNFYKDFLQEIANLNHCSITSVCGVIVENFLSFNKDKNRIPLFKKYVSIVFAKKVNKFAVDDSETIEEESLDWDQMINDLESQNGE